MDFLIFINGYIRYAASKTGFFFRAHSRITTKARRDLKIEILALQVTFKHRGHANCGFFNKFLKFNWVTVAESYVQRRSLAF